MKLRNAIIGAGAIAPVECGSVWTLRGPGYSAASSGRRTARAFLNQPVEEPTFVRNWPRCWVSAVCDPIGSSVSVTEKRCLFRCAAPLAK